MLSIETIICLSLKHMCWKMKLQFEGHLRMEWIRNQNGNTLHYVWKTRDRQPLTTYLTMQASKLYQKYKLWNWIYFLQTNLFYAVQFTLIRPAVCFKIYFFYFLKTTFVIFKYLFFPQTKKYLFRIFKNSIRFYLKYLKRNSKFC